MGEEGREIEADIVWKPPKLQDRNSATLKFLDSWRAIRRSL